ncbi:MAG: PAS domain S-box protein [Acidobacteriaceae bacterium]
MEEQQENLGEIGRLQRCINDLVSILALPAVWSSGEPKRILETFLDALLEMLDLDFFYGSITLDSGDAPIEVLRVAQPSAISLGPEGIRQALHQWFGQEPHQWPRQTRRPIGDREIAICPLPLGIGGNLGFLVAGTRRASFPEQTERLILNVAANQAAIGLQQALLLGEQKRVAGELDRRVAERTAELAETNKELHLQVGLLQHLPVSAWTLKPDGTPDFVNQVWLEYSGQTLDFVCSHPEAWMTAVHPDDREAASRAFWNGIRSGQGFAMETRSLRAKDRSWRWHLNQAVALRDTEGKVLKFVGTTTDIDDQKRADEGLRTSEANLRRVIDTIPTLSWCNLPDGANEFLSKGWHEYTGLSPEEAHGWGWSAAFHPDDLPPLMKRWQEMLASGEPGEIEARLRRYDGVYRWFLIRAAPFLDETGTIIRWYGTSTDIEDRKRAEDDLRRSEARYRVVVETASDAVISMDERGIITLANPATKQVFGYNPDELIGKPLTMLMPDGAQELHEAGYKRYLETGVRHLNWQGTELTALRASGEEFPAGVSFGEMSADGQKIFTGFIRDISKRKRAEEAVLASRRDLRLTVDTMPVLTWSAEQDGSVNFFNQRWLDYTGLSAVEALGWGWSKALHPDDLDRISGYWRSVIIAGQPGETEARLRRSDGDYRWFLFRASPLRDEAGAIIRWYGTNIDIEDRKRSEEALRESEQRFRLIVDGIAGLVAIMSPGGEVEVVNRQCLTYFGRTVEELKGWSTSDAVHPEDLPAVVAAWTHSFGTGSDYDVDHRLLRADGEYRWFHARGLPLRDAEGRALRWYVLLTDIDDRKQAEEALARARAELAHVSRVSSLSAFTASIAHEINQPLSGIVTNASTCLRMLDATPPNLNGARETVRRALRDGNRASDVITHLRTLFSRKEVKTEPVDLNEIVREVIALSVTELQQNSVILRQDFAEGLPRVQGDRIQLQQVTLNLLRNAADAMSAVDDRPRELSVSTEPAGEEVQVKVRDTGIGIDPAAMERLFESFYTTKQDGMGIGLSVSRSIIEAHNGRLWAMANNGPGATFAFSVPCTWLPETAAGRPEEAPRL